ncbi:hypothetical protein LCGC14_1129860 [marine sediment metagenome]|uniref:Transcription factor zinc-finger domain-containing protein n=1 Tax=marine sediment metagenome TaxID=412755 RepID=A0A0F9MP71_9ZZZZ
MSDEAKTAEQCPKCGSGELAYCSKGDDDWMSCDDCEHVWPQPEEADVIQAARIKGAEAMKAVYEPRLKQLREALYGLWAGDNDGLSLGDMVPRMRKAERVLSVPVDDPALSVRDVVEKL